MPPEELKLWLPLELPLEPVELRVALVPEDEGWLLLTPPPELEREAELPLELRLLLPELKVRPLPELKLCLLPELELLELEWEE